MGATGALNIDINSPVTGQYDELIVSGTAILTGGTLNLNGGVPGTYDVLNAAGGLGGTIFAAVNSVYPQTSTYTANILSVELKGGMSENELSELVETTRVVNLKKPMMRSATRILDISTPGGGRRLGTQHPR